MLTNLSAKKCATILFIICVIISLLFAYSFALEHSTDTEYAAVTKNIDAPKVLPTQITNIPLAITLGTISFLICVSLSALLSELYYCILEFLRQNIRKD